MKYRIILLLGMLWIGIAGCSPRVQPVQSSQIDLVDLDAQNPLGQTLVARYDGLSGIHVYLSPNQTGDGVVALHLRSEPGAEQDLATAVIPLSQVTQARHYRFDFPPRNDSNQQYYYALLEVDGTGSLGVGASVGSTYQDGAMYQKGTPRDGQVTFSLEYEVGQLAVGLVGELVIWVGVFALSGLIFIAPGWAVLGWLWRGWYDLSLPGRVGLASGTSLAACAILLVITEMLGLHLGAWYARGLIIFAISSLVWQVFKRQKLRRIETKDHTVTSKSQSWSTRLPGITLMIIIGLIMVTRWWAVRSIEAPMWGDSVQHTVITQLIIDHGGLFKSWEPYAPYGSFGNQFGFPATAALLSWVSGMEASQAVLWTGQILNVLAVMALYPLAVRLAKGQQWAGVGVVLAAGLVSTMPAFYFNWGRYAQLAGQVLLPAALWMLWDVVETPTALRQAVRVKALPWRKIILAGTVLGGMVMYQYRTPFFYITFILAWVVGWWLLAWRFNPQRWLSAILKVGLVILIGIVIFFPWGLRILTTQVSELVVSDASKTAIWESIQTDYQTWREVFKYIPPTLVVAALAASLWSLAKREWLVLSLVWWAAWLASIYSWNLIGVPGAQQVSSFAVLIGLYIPGSLLCGWLLGQFAESISRWKGVEVLLVLVVVGIGAWYAWEQRAIAEPQTYAMVTRPDRRAMVWIREETEPEALFLVEGFRAYYNTTAVGSDAGWWIPLLAERDNTMPPLYALGSEVPLDASYSSQIVETVAALEMISLNTGEGVALLCELGVSHVYIGQLQGLVGLTWLNQLYSPQELLDQPTYQLVYHQDRVYIFALQPEACER
jgi:hypothetical protein